MSKKQIAEKQEKKRNSNYETYTVKQITYADGTRRMERTNEGFTPLELLGMSDFISWEVPDTVKREVVVSYPDR